jgi:hypothetical protein
MSISCPPVIYHLHVVPSHVHVLCKHTDTTLLYLVDLMVCFWVSVCSKCIVQKLKDEDIKCCSTCTIDLGPAPLEKLRSCLFPSLFTEDL